MKAITIKQPFATLIAEGIKEYEFRTWKTKYRGEILIHAGKGINKKAMEGTIMAHVDGNVPNILINIPKLSPYYIGQLIYFFEKACAISGYILNINPFDQPGVEDYKKNMFKLLEKPGY